MKKLYSNICVIMSGIALLVFFGGYIFSGLCRSFGFLVPTENFLSATIGVIAVILSIAFPIVVGNVAQGLKAYKSDYIANIFKEEKAYKAMRCVIFFLIVSLLLFIFFNNPSIGKKYGYIERWIGCCMLALGIASVVIFYYFTRRFTEYVVNTDKLLLDQFEKDRGNLDYKGSEFDGQLNLMHEYWRVGVNKIQREDYDKLDVVLGAANSILLSSYSEVKKKRRGRCLGPVNL